MTFFRSFLLVIVSSAVIVGDSFSSERDQKAADFLQKVKERQAEMRRPNGVVYYPGTALKSVHVCNVDERCKGVPRNMLESGRVVPIKSNDPEGLAALLSKFEQDRFFLGSKQALAAAEAFGIPVVAPSDFGNTLSALESHPECCESQQFRNFVSSIRAQYDAYLNK